MAGLFSTRECIAAVVMSATLAWTAWSALGQLPPAPPPGRPFGPPRPGMGPPGLGRPGIPPPAAIGPVDNTPPKRSAVEAAKAAGGLIDNAELEFAAADGKSPRGFQLTGDATFGYLGTGGKDLAGWGVRFVSAEKSLGDKPGGTLTSKICRLSGSERWYRLSIRGLAQPEFRVANDDLWLQAEFFQHGGADALDHIKKRFYAQVEQERRDLTDPGTNRNIGTAVWRTYAIEFRTPFAEVDALRVGVGFGNGAGSAVDSEFWIDAIELTPIPEPAGYLPATTASSTAATPPALASLVKLGGRWYYDPRGSDARPPAQFDHANVDRLYYLAGRLETPFAGNTTAWLRKGNLDRAGKLVAQDRFVADNVVVSFTAEHLVIRSHNLPNHPTAVFPDRWRALDGNPNYVKEQSHTWHLPLEPKPNANRVAMSPGNANRALNGGPIGVAVNGVVFFNPFDADAVDALWRLDRCCGHPAPDYTYHYHKYPVCLYTPWNDDGRGHSPLIGFAFDGYPVYGPYEAAGELAKNSRTNPLDEFNSHEDAARGRHYHVTPGKYPHILGGYWGLVESRNLRRGPPPRPGG